MLLYRNVSKLCNCCFNFVIYSNKEGRYVNNTIYVYIYIQLQNIFISLTNNFENCLLTNTNWSSNNG